MELQRQRMISSGIKFLLEKKTVAAAVWWDDDDTSVAIRTTRKQSLNNYCFYSILPAAAAAAQNWNCRIDKTVYEPCVCFLVEILHKQVVVVVWQQRKCFCRLWRSRQIVRHHYWRKKGVSRQCSSSSSLSVKGLSKFYFRSFNFLLGSEWRAFPFLHHHDEDAVCVSSLTRTLQQSDVKVCA